MLVPVQLPELGVGVVYFPGLEPLLEEARGLLDVVEIEPQVFWLKTRSGNAPYRLSDDLPHRLAAYGKPVLVHGVGCPVGGTVPADPAALAMFAQTVRVLSSPWCSEHLSFNRIRTREGECSTGFLLPPSQTPESAAVAVDNIRHTKSSLGVPFAFETGVSYLQPRPGEMPDGDFFRAVAEQADCGILLDLHNLWTNERNGRQTALEAIAQLPLDRVWEVHLAGGQSLDSYWLDAHSGVAPEALMELAAQIIPRLPNLKAVIFEIVPDYIPAYKIRTEQLVDQI